MHIAYTVLDMSCSCANLYASGMRQQCMTTCEIWVSHKYILTLDVFNHSMMGGQFEKLNMWFDKQMENYLRMISVLRSE